MRRITPFEALIPEPYVVLGARLKPLTLGHAALLLRLGGECWIDGGSCGLDELLVGVAICSSDSFNSFLADLYNGGFATRMEALASQVKTGDVQKEIELFARYISEGSEGPTVLFEDTKTTATRSHAIQSLRVQLMKFFRVPVSEVMDVPLSVALWDMATLSEINQVGRIWTEEDDKIKEQADEFAKKWADTHPTGGANG